MTSAADPYATGQVGSKTGRLERPPKPSNRSILVGAGSGNKSIHHRTPRFGPAIDDSSSPLASVLLDPHHQPAPKNSRSQRKFGAHSRLRSSHRPLEDQVEDDQEDAGAVAGINSGIIDEEGGVDDYVLGESWKTTQTGNRDESVEQDTNANMDERDPGVLGLVYQFSKAQTDGRGTGVHM